MKEIKTITNEKELIDLFNFLSETFYDDAKAHHEHYYPMTERLEEMKTQLNKDNELILYIEDKGKIIAGLTSKNMSKDKITIGVMAVDKNYQRQGYAKTLIQEFEKRCKEKGIYKIDLGARFRACPLYLSQNYIPSLMVQVYDFATIEDIKKENIYNLKIKNSYQTQAFGFVIFEIDQIKEEYINHFETNVKTANAQYIFEKNVKENTNAKIWKRNKNTKYWHY